MLHLNILENKINPEEKKGPFIFIKPEKSKISDKNRSNNIEIMNSPKDKKIIFLSLLLLSFYII